MTLTHLHSFQKGVELGKLIERDLKHDAMLVQKLVHMKVRECDLGTIHQYMCIRKR